MKKYLLFNILFIMLLAISGNCQNYIDIIKSADKNTPDSIILQNCIDSISKYVYLDSRRITPFMEASEKLINEGSDIPNRLRLDYVIQQIYNEYNYNNNLGIFELIESNKAMLSLDGLSIKQINNFKYLEAYTLLSLGEVDDAQEIFYELYEISKETRDTSLMLQTLSSLGSLFEQQGEFVNAEKYYFDFINLLPPNKGTHKANFYIDLVQLYIESKQYEKAEKYNSIALKLADSLELVDLQIDFLLQKATINLETNKPNLARESYYKARNIQERIGNSNYLKKCLITYANILKYENNNGEALSIFERFIQSGEKGEFAKSELLNYYESASQVANKNGDYYKAFQYLTKANTISDSLFVEKQKEKSKYLQIKYEASKKEKENALLNSQILQVKAQRKLLYAISAIFLISSIYLFFAFFQKRQYNKSLESEVLERTSELTEANKSLKILNTELSDLTYALSHDLKEPLMILTQFSSLAEKEGNKLNLDPKNKLLEYLSFLSKNGNRLKLTIEDISNFHLIQDHLKAENTSVDLNKLIHKVQNSILSSDREKKVIINSSELPILYSNENLLLLVFKNLINNGIKYNKSSQPTLEISYEKGLKDHHIHFKDNGIGIDPKFHQRIFNMFYRLHNREEFSGSGLGLSIAKKITTELGGDIRIVESDEDKGSWFEVRLPITST